MGVDATAHGPRSGCDSACTHLVPLWHVNEFQILAQQKKTLDSVVGGGDKTVSERT